MKVSKDLLSILVILVCKKYAKKGQDWYLICGQMPCPSKGFWTFPNCFWLTKLFELVQRFRRWVKEQNSLLKISSKSSSTKEIQIISRLFLVRHLLLQTKLVPFQPASTVGGSVIHWTGLNWLELAWQYIAMTRNNLCIWLDPSDDSPYS